MMLFQHILSIHNGYFTSLELCARGCVDVGRMVQHCIILLYPMFDFIVNILFLLLALI